MKKQSKPGRPAKMLYLHIRLPRPTIERLDSFARTLNRTTGINVTRSEAVRVLINEGLDRREAVPEEGL